VLGKGNPSSKIKLARKKSCRKNTSAYFCATMPKRMFNLDTRFQLYKKPFFRRSYCEKNKLKCLCLASFSGGYNNHKAKLDAYH
jgi:hypothetical protein